MKIGDAWVESSVVTAVERSRSDRLALVVWTCTKPEALEVRFGTEEDLVAELDRVAGELEKSNG